jgi:hypothetical protein
MSFTFDTSITGSAQTGFTSPTYTVTVEKGIKEQIIHVTALGGTQTDVRANSISDPFRLQVSLPAQYRAALPSVNGVSPQQPKNVIRVRVIKGGRPATDAASQIIDFDAKLAIPAGVDAADPAQVRAALSLFIGALTEVSAGFGDTLLQGNM